MNIITPLTREVTESTVNRSDTQQPSLSLGGGGAQMQSVTGTGVKEHKEDPRASMSEEELKAMYAGQEAARYPENKEQLTDIKEDPRASMSEEELKAMYAGQETARYGETKPETTQGGQAQKVDDINRAIEKWNEYINDGKYNDYNFMEKLTKNEYKQFEEYLKNNNIKPNEYLNKETLSGFISHMLGNYKNELHGIKTNPSYDNRTDEQIRNDKLLEEQRNRDDTAHQRMVNDMRAAGLNPAAFKGANYGGGGGGGSGSRDDDEEEKRKRRRKEKFEQDRARKAEKLRQAELITGVVTKLMGTATKGIGAGVFMANQNKQAELNRQDQWRLRQETRDHELNRLADIESMKYDEDLERWLRQKTGKSRR